jgi:sugar lactone lactonase YvrE
MTSRRFHIALLAFVLAACNNEGPPPPHTSISDDDRRNLIAAPPAIATISTGLAGPESVLYDPQQDVYFISNINGGLLDRDNNGFISRVDAKTLNVNLKWIEGGKNNVTLDGPKGMAIAGDSLYVSDVAAVRKFDRHTGAALAAIPLPGTTTINDLTTDGKNIYASDTGVIPGPGDTFEATGTDSIWIIENDHARKIASGNDLLKQPNGLEFVDGKLWVVTFEGNELYQLDGGRKSNVMTLPREQLDGVVHTADGTWFVTSWKGMAVYRGSGKGSFEPILQAVPTPADIGYDTKRHLLLLPSSSNNSVTLHPVR